MPYLIVKKHGVATTYFHGGSSQSSAWSSRALDAKRFPNQDEAKTFAATLPLAGDEKLTVREETDADRRMTLG